MKKLFTRKAVTPVALFLAGAITGVAGLMGARLQRHHRDVLPIKVMSPFHVMENMNSLMKQNLNQTIRQIDDGEMDFAGNIAVDDSGANFVYRVPIENIRNQKVKVDVHDGMVTVTAHSQESKENTKGENSSTEEFISQYQKTFPLVAGANPAKMDFKIEKDLIVIRFPKLKGV